jgi:hypothetical protein
VVWARLRKQLAPKEACRPGLYAGCLGGMDRFGESGTEWPGGSGDRCHLAMPPCQMIDHTHVGNWRTGGRFLACLTAAALTVFPMWGLWKYPCSHQYWWTSCVLRGGTTLAPSACEPVYFLHFWACRSIGCLGYSCLEFLAMEIFL